MTQRKRYRHFTREERLEIGILRSRGYSLRDIARQLEYSHTSVCRELRRNKVNGVYDPKKAHHKAYAKRKYSKWQGMKISLHDSLKDYLTEKLTAGWSPEQIAGRLKRHQTHLPYVSHRVIYKWLYSDDGQRFCRYLRSRRQRRRKQKGETSKRAIIKNRIFIDKRPQIVNRRTRIGDFEVDRIESNKSSRAGLLVVYERKTKYCRAVKTFTRTPLENKKALVRALTGIEVLRTLTYDNDIAFASHEEVNEALGTQSYFCFPHHPWEKGGIEQTNRWIREYIPKGSDIGTYSDAEIALCVERLNHRPRKCLRYKTPHEVMTEHNLLTLPALPQKDVVHLRV